MKIITVEYLTQLIKHHGFENFMMDLMKALKRDFGKWHSFTKIPRPSMHVKGGVLELMPICDNEKYYSFKYVNCHPKNPLTGLSTVIATGQLARIDTGYPLLFTEMTILTALRTAAMSALATDFMAKKSSKIVAIIGTGAQSEFQIKALQLVRDIKEVRYFDIDKNAMEKLEKNLSDEKLKLIACKSAKEVVLGADIVIVCTASKSHGNVVKNSWITNGVHLNAIGGDTIGKTELEFSILKRGKIVVEYFDQAYIEGEIQRLTREEAEKLVIAEMHELVSGLKVGRKNKQDITIFDSVGIALEDYSALRLVYELSLKYDIGQDLNFVPNLANPKNLISVLM